MRKMVPSEEKGVRIERFTITIIPENITQYGATTVYYASTGYTPPEESAIQFINLKMDSLTGTVGDIANILKVGYTLEKWPTAENEQVIWFGANPNITNSVDFEIIYIHQNTL